MIGLSGRTALVTGSTQGVGAAIAASLAKAGAFVIVHGLHRDAAALESLHRCQAFGHGAELVLSDLFQDMATLERDFVAPLLQRYSTIDLLVNNAGTYIDTSFLEMTESLFNRTFHLNVKVPYFLAQQFARHWLTASMRGRILFTGSINGLLAEPDHTAYDASKSAIAGLVRSLCVSLAPMGIRVNALAPGLVRTPLTNRVLSADPNVLEWMRLHTPNAEVPEPAVCGPLAAFLLSDLAEHIHGQTIYVDGGMSAWQQPDVPDAYRRGRGTAL